MVNKKTEKQRKQSRKREVFNMKKTFIMLFLSILFFVSGKQTIAAYDPIQHYYSDLYKVIEIVGNKAVLKNCMGFTYTIVLSDKDIEIGDFFTAIVYDNKTPYIMDDQIVRLKYCRVDLF